MRHDGQLPGSWFIPPHTKLCGHHMSVVCACYLYLYDESQPPSRFSYEGDRLPLFDADLLVTGNIYSSQIDYGTGS